MVVGHGELWWHRALADAAAGQLQPVYGSREADYDFADAPIPAFELLDIARYNRLTVQTSRGCPHHCDFCAGSSLFCRRYRQKPPEKVLAEVDRLLELLRASGCAEVLVGLESPVADGLSGTQTGLDWKLGRLPRYRDALRNIQAHGIRVNGCFVLGLDGQGPDIFDRVRDFVREADLFDVQITVLTPFPGTPLYARLCAEGRLLEEKAWNRCTLFDVNFRPSGMSVGELERGFPALGVDIYSAEWTKRRRNRFKRRLRARQHIDQEGTT